jgi:hypothetical protein
MPLLKILPSLISQGSFTGSFSGTGSYARRALTASYVLGGAAGSSGTSGANGTSGSSGSSGANGTSGSSGNSGTSGSSGTSATAGSSGTSGVGSPGTSGSSGSSGTSGSSGNSGTSGSSGGTGSSGTSGAGSPGSSGSSGTSTTPALSLGQTYIGNGSTTTYALSQSVANRDQILVNVDGVLQGRSGNYYTVSGTTLTLSSPPQNGSIIDIRYINGGSGIVTTGSLAKQTILYNVVSGSQNVITGLNLSGNKWNVNVIEEWDAVVVPGDQYYNSCSLLMHFNGTNGSTTMTDNSKNNFTVTSVNGAAISTAQSKFGGASVYFDGTNDYLSVPDNESLEPGTNNLTWEMWIKTTSGVQYATLYSRMPDSFTSGMWSLMINAASSTAGDIALYVADYSNVTPLLLTTAVSIRDDVWHHIAIVRNGSAWVCYVDGTSRATGTFSGGISNLSSGARIGADQFYGRYFIGYIDELRITKGVARYTSNFTPPNSQFYNNVSTYQSLTKYIGTVGGLNDANVDYGVQKLSDSSLKVVKMTVPSNPPSGSLSASIDRVYVNVLDYNNVSVTSSYATNALNSINSLDIPKIKSIIYTNSSYTPTTASAIDLFKPNTSYITISGSNFKPSASIFIDNTSGSVVTYVNSNKLNVNVISKNEGTYPIYLMNTDGASAFKINAITYITSQDQFQYLVLAGGGGGGIAHAGGGGAGGFRTGSLGLNRSVPYTISVGSGGSSSPSRSVNGTNGGNSVFASITSTGGGGGGSEYKPANPGGSGGGGATQGAGGSGTVSQGNNGGAGSPTSPPYAGGGGGGAGAIGGSYTPGSGGNGGNGLISNISSTPIYYAGGGGGGVYGGYAGITNRGAGGLGGGGNGNYGNGNGSAGEASRGGGGGGGGYPNENGYNGGSGIVIVKYLSSRTLTIGVGLTSSTVITGSYKITTFTAGSDTITIS